MRTPERPPDQEAHPSPLPKTHDELYRFRGLWDEGGVCRIRIFQREGETPVVVCTELPENDNTSVTNAVEYLVAEVIAEHFPHRFEYEEPVVWIEHYPPPESGRYAGHRRTGRADYDRVTFASWTPRYEFARGAERITLGEPEWRPMPAHEVERLIGRHELGGGSAQTT